MESFLEHLYSSFITEQRYMLILHGLFNTLIVTLGALVFGFVLGTLIACGIIINFKVCALLNPKDMPASY